MAFNPFNLSTQYVNSSRFITLEAANSSAVILGLPLNIDRNWTLSGPTVLNASSVLFSGGIIHTGVNTLTITYNYFSLGPNKCFDLTGGGSVVATTSYRGSYIDIEGFGGGFGSSSADQLAFSSAIAFATSTTSGLTIKLNSPLYTVSGGFTIATNAAPQCVRISGLGPLNSKILHTGNNVLFKFTGRPTSTPLHAIGSGFDNVWIMGTDSISDTSASAAQFSDSFGYYIHDYQIANYTYGKDVIIKNDILFTEGFKAEDGYHISTRLAFSFERTNHAGNTASFRDTYIRNCKIDLGSAVAGKAAISMASDGFDKTIYSSEIDIAVTNPSIGNYQIISVPEPSANGKVNQITSSKLTVRLDGITGNSSIDGQVIWARNRDADNLGKGQILDCDVDILGINPQTLDLSSAAPPSIIPVYQTMICGQNNAGGMSVNSNNQPIVEARGPKMVVVVPVQANRASYDYAIGSLPAYSQLRLNISGVMDANGGSQSYIVTTRAAGNSTVVQLDSNNGVVLSGISVSGGTGPQLTVTIDNSTYATAGQIVISLEGIGQ